MPTDTFARTIGSRFIDHGIVAPPPSKRPWYKTPQPVLGPTVVLKQHQEWKNWNELTIKVKGIMPEDLKTFTIWENFSREGYVAFIEIFENPYGQREGTAKVKYSPPPDIAIWAQDKGRYLFTSTTNGQYQVFIAAEGTKRGQQIQSPIKKYVFYNPKMNLDAGKIHFGLMIDPTTMMPLHEACSISTGDTKFQVDLLRNRITAFFKVHFSEPGGACNRINRYMFQVPFAALKDLQFMNVSAETYALVLSLESPPQFYRKREDTQTGHSDEGLLWSEFDTWYRQTDIVYDPRLLQTEKVALHKKKPVIDIGRWTTYIFEFSKLHNPRATYDNIKQALQDFNIPINEIEKLGKEPNHAAHLWSLIDPHTSQNLASDLRILQGGGSALFYLPFEVRYQLEVCISHELLNEFNLDRAFIIKLADIASQDPAKARNILEWVASDRNGKRIYDPMSIFDNYDAMSYSVKTEIPHYCAYFRKATITPSTIYFSSPTVETTNRVLRHYARENQDGRFLRVQFTDERAEGRIHSCAEKSRNDELFTRVYRTLYNGIQIGDRHYKFLAFGNSQFRENGAYFFCETDHLSCDDIRQWMGSFTHIQVVAKYAARLGQCFSTTRAINGLSKPDIIKIPDVKSEDEIYDFTDGVGKISPFLAQMIAAELGVRSNTAPSAFQFRLGGCKGILVVWPEAKEREVHIRKSQEKFKAVYNGLEIIRCSRFSLATINRQTITILSSLGVPDEVFLKMLSEQLANYQSAMSDDELAVSLLLRYIDDNQMTINIATMIRNGFMAERDPFVLSLLHLWRSWSIKLLKEKAKIIVEEGAFVLGCVDETNTLKGYQSPSAAHGEKLLAEELPEIFIQVPDKVDPNKYVVIEGVCLVGRNPSLHPGDLRVVRAVDVKALHHLRDVVVFPINGERDIPSMCSGGDLDGDDYFVIWDSNLLPKEWNCDPMNHEAPKPKNEHRPVVIKDLMKFFVRYMKNDSLPTIAHAHVAWSDYTHDSVKDQKCLELATLHSKAVDYVKTGEPAQMPKRLRPRQWPHFMEKKHKNKEAIYRSTKILGQLYDKVETVNFVPQYSEPFDKRILRAYALDDALLKTVRQIKTQYDTAMRRLMAQQEINTEFEIWSTFVLSRPRVGSDYKVQEEIARLSDALKAQFRAVCIEKAGSSEFAVLGPFVAGMYKVTKEEMDIALAECRSTKTVGGRKVPMRKMEPKYMPLMTFPWLFEKELGRIATGIEVYEEQDLGLRMAIDSGRSRRRRGAGETDVEDFIRQEDGVIIHRGEELDLFRQDDFDEFVDASDSETYSDQDREDHDLMMGEGGEVVLATEFQVSKNVPENLLSGTGLEDVVPTIKMDGFTDPREEWQYAQYSSSSTDSPVNIGSHGSSISPTSPISLVSPAEDASAAHTEADTPIEEEIVHLDLNRESSLEKLARMISPEAEAESVHGTNEVVEGEGENAEREEEVVEIELKESPLEKLARMMAS